MMSVLTWQPAAGYQHLHHLHSQFFLSGLCHLICNKPFSPHLGVLCASTIFTASTTTANMMQVCVQIPNKEGLKFIIVISY